MYECVCVFLCYIDIRIVDITGFFILSRYLKMAIWPWGRGSVKKKKEVMRSSLFIMLIGFAADRLLFFQTK